MGLLAGIFRDFPWLYATLQKCQLPYTPPKFNIAPENGGFQ